MVDHPHAHASTQCVRSIVVTPAGHPPFLIVEIEITCEVCGGFQARIAGHHLRALVEALSEVVAAQGALCGQPMPEANRETVEWQSWAPAPGKESLN